MTVSPISSMPPPATSATWPLRTQTSFNSGRHRPEWGESRVAKGRPNTRRIRSRETEFSGHEHGITHLLTMGYGYPGGPVVGPDKRFHVFWGWRDTPDCATNNNLSYARSPDLIHWETAAGQSVGLPMTLGTKGLIVDPIPSGGGIINGGARLVFDSQRRPMIVYHKSDAAGNMQLYVARFAEGKWARRVITAWDKPVKFSGGGAMPFIGIGISAVQRVDEGVWAAGYRHRDYGNGTVAFSEATLDPVTSKFRLPPRELPAELERPEIKFHGIGVRRADDLGESGDPNVRDVLTWDVLPPNHDRERSGPLPPAAMLRVCKLVRNGSHGQ